MTIIAEPPREVTPVPVPLPEPSPARAPRTERSHRARRAAAILAPTTAVALHAAYYGLWIEDDIGITYAYARSITSGNGFVLQPGAAPVEAYSNPLWLAVLTVGRVLGVFDHGAWFGVPDIVAFPKLVALLCCAGMFACFYSVARRMTSRPVLLTAAAGCLTAAVPSFVVWAFSGLENPLFALLAVALATVVATAAYDGRLLERRTATLCGLLTAGAALTRPDGLIYVLAFPLALMLLLERGHLHDALRAAGRSLLMFAIPFGAYEIFRLAVFSYWLPNTARAKAQSIPGITDFNRPAELIEYAGWLMVVIAVVAVVAALIRGSAPARTVLTPVLLTLGLAVAAFAILRTDWMAQARFATPIWPLAALAGTTAVFATLPHLRVRGRVAAGVAIVAAVTVSAAGWSNYAYLFHRAPTTPMCYVAMRTGMTVNSYADLLGLRNASLAAVDAGGSSLTSRLRFIDLAGLANEPIANFWQQKDMAGFRNYIFDTERPTFIQLWDDWGITTTLTSDPRLDRDYVQILFPSPITGTWVRRDAVSDPSRLVRAQFWATAAQGDLIARTRPEMRDEWQCATTLQRAPYRLSSMNQG